MTHDTEHKRRGEEQFVVIALREIPRDPQIVLELNIFENATLTDLEGQAESIRRALAREDPDDSGGPTSAA